MPVVRQDGRRGHGHDLRRSGADDHRGDGGMIIEGLAIGELTGETGVAMHGGGRKGVGAIQGHPPLGAKDPNMRQPAVLFKALKDLNTHRIAVARRDRIEQRSDLIVTGELFLKGCSKFCHLFVTRCGISSKSIV
jgi:hypothetical protein